MIYRMTLNSVQPNLATTAVIVAIYNRYELQLRPVTMPHLVKIPDISNSESKNLCEELKMQVCL